MNLPESVQTEIAIVGGGPVGLFLGCLLATRGIDCVVLERRTAPDTHSRAIGIHPPVLAALATVDVADDLVSLGVPVTGGRAYYGPNFLGRLDIADPGPYGFALAVPQSITEALLERRLQALAPKALHRGVPVFGVQTANTHSVVRWRAADGSAGTVTARYVVGTDGKHSIVRNARKIPFPGGAYPDSYLMGDFADSTPFGGDAVLCMSPEGIVESFPLPDGLRRWVVRLPHRYPTADPGDIARLVWERTRFAVPAETCRWISPFGIEHYLAATLWQDVLLAGDAAHVVSPIGGQGMNLGLMDAADLADCLRAVLREEADATKTLSAYSHRRRQIARLVQNRAFFNTLLGRPCTAIDPRRAAVWTILNVPTFSRRFARLFTMRDLKNK